MDVPLVILGATVIVVAVVVAIVFLKQPDRMLRARALRRLGATLVVAGGLAALGLRRTAAAGLMLLAVGIIPLAVSGQPGRIRVARRGQHRAGGHRRALPRLCPADARGGQGRSGHPLRGRISTFAGVRKVDMRPLAGALA